MALVAAAQAGSLAAMRRREDAKPQTYVVPASSMTMAQRLDALLRQKFVVLVAVDQGLAQQIQPLLVGLVHLPLPQPELAHLLELQELAPQAQARLVRRRGQRRLQFVLFLRVLDHQHLLLARGQPPLVAQALQHQDLGRLARRDDVLGRVGVRLRLGLAVLGLHRRVADARLGRVVEGRGLQKGGVVGGRAARKCDAGSRASGSTSAVGARSTPGATASRWGTMGRWKNL